jgi:hypothetical protein
MKTTTPKLVIISFFSFILFISCSKKDNTIDRNTVLLIQDTWKFEIYGLDENNNGIIEETENAMLPCEADDIFTFNANGTGVFASGCCAMQYGRASHN